MKVSQRAYTEVKDLTEAYLQEAENYQDEIERLSVDARESLDKAKGLKALLDTLEVEG